MNYLLPLLSANPLLPLGKAFDPNQPRDEDGKWTDAGGGGGALVSARGEILAGSQVPIPEGGIEVFHGTSSDYLESIKANGLSGRNPRGVPSAEGGFYEGIRGESVFVTFDRGTATRYANHAHGINAKPVVLTITIPKGTRVLEDNWATLAAMVPDGIPAKWITGINVDGITQKRAASAYVVVFVDGVEKVAPRTLYVKRRLLNAGAVRAWAAQQGVASALPAGDMHVTVAFSKEPVDWAGEVEKAFDPNQPRAEDGKWVSGGGSAGGASSWKTPEAYDELSHVEENSIISWEKKGKYWTNSEPLVLYHGTTESRASKIEAEGLQHGNLTFSRAYASEIGGIRREGEAAVVFRVTAPAGSVYPVFHGPRGVSTDALSLAQPIKTVSRIPTISKVAGVLSLRPDQHPLTVVAGDRVVHQFPPRATPNGALVLAFESPELHRRWQEFRDAGASWDFPEYQPHVTITYSVAAADVVAIEPYRGPLIFGPEEFAEVDDGWAGDIVEEPLEKGFDPNQLRDEWGRWTDTGTAFVGYHGTNEEVLESVRQHGLQPGFQSGHGRSSSVFISAEHSQAGLYASDSMSGKRAIIFKIHVPKDKLDLFRDENRPGDKDNVGVGITRLGVSIPSTWIKGYYLTKPAANPKWAGQRDLDGDLISLGDAPPVRKADQSVLWATLWFDGEEEPLIKANPYHKKRSIPRLRSIKETRS